MLPNISDYSVVTNEDCEENRKIIVASLVACNYVMSMRMASNRIIMVSELPAISVTKHQQLLSCYKGKDVLA